MFGIDPIYIMLLSILAMTVGFAGFGFLLYRMYQVLNQIRDHASTISLNSSGAMPVVKPPPAPSAREIMDALARLDPIKEPLMVQHYTKLLNDEMARMFHSASEPTVAVPTGALQTAMADELRAQTGYRSL